MTFYELIKRGYWALDEWIAYSLGLGEYYGADEEDEVDVVDEVTDEDNDNDEEEVADEDDEMADADDGYDDMYKYHDHQA